VGRELKKGGKNPSNKRVSLVLPPPPAMVKGKNNAGGGDQTVMRDGQRTGEGSLGLAKRKNNRGQWEKEERRLVNFKG